MEVRECLWWSGGTVADPDIEGPLAPLQDGGRFGTAAAGEVDRRGCDAGEVLDSRVERADLQSGAAAREVGQGRKHLIESIRREEPMDHRLVERADPDLDASFPEGLELEGELVGDESSWRRDVSSLWWSSGRREIRSARRCPIRSWYWSGSVRHHWGRRAVRVPTRRRLVARTRAEAVPQIRTTGGLRLLRR